MKSEVIVVTERERLIELLMQGELEADKQGVFNCSRSKWKAEIMADFLLENGVIVPLSKIDGTLYHVRYCFSESMWEIIEETVHQIRRTPKGTMLIMSSGRLFTYKDFNKIVFRTKEEAEKVLAERNSE